MGGSGIGSTGIGNDPGRSAFSASMVKLSEDLPR